LELPEDKNMFEDIFSSFNTIHKRNGQSPRHSHGRFRLVACCTNQSLRVILFSYFTAGCPVTAILPLRLSLSYRKTSSIGGKL